jgi:hypothetical protein
MTKPVSRAILIAAFVLTGVVLSFVAEPKIAVEKIRAERESGTAHRLSNIVKISDASASRASKSAELRSIYKARKSYRGASPQHTAFATQQAVSTIVAELKARIALPFDIEVEFENCGGPDSFYDEDERKILICYELVDAYYDLFSSTIKASAARDDATKDAIVAMFLHEVAHALISGWRLPITGREEDAADQFSTLWLLNSIADGDQMALNAARSFKLLAELEKDQEKDYSDSHSLDEQRFFNIVCLVYGREPERYEHLIRSEVLPGRRAYECEQDYARLNKSWLTLLAPHLISNEGITSRGEEPLFRLTIAGFQISSRERIGLGSDLRVLR